MCKLAFEYVTLASGFMVAVLLVLLENAELMLAKLEPVPLRRGGRTGCKEAVLVEAAPFEDILVAARVSASVRSVVGACTTLLCWSNLCISSFSESGGSSISSGSSVKLVFEILGKLVSCLAAETKSFCVREAVCMTSRVKDEYTLAFKQQRGVRWVIQTDQIQVVSVRKRSLLSRLLVQSRGCTPNQAGNITSAKSIVRTVSYSTHKHQTSLVRIQAGLGSLWRSIVILAVEDIIDERAGTAERSVGGRQQLGSDMEASPRGRRRL